MNYNFPTIRNINDVLPYVKDREEFVVADRGDHTIINYNLMTSDTFRPLLGEEDDPHANIIRRECRGLIFDNETGEIIRRPYHKFKNLGEDVDYLPENLNLNRPHFILDKLDGSMIAPYKSSNGIWYVGTKMGQTEIALEARTFIDAHSNYWDLIEEAEDAGFTAIFEWMSPNNRIVIDYGAEPSLVLTAMRHKIEGDYLEYGNLITLAQENNVPFVKATYINETADFLKAVPAMVDIEGFVVRFDDGHMFKIKTDTYVAIHKMKDNLLYERNVIPLIFDNQIDDVLPYLTMTDKDRLLKYADQFINWFGDVVRDVSFNTFKLLALKGYDRKRFALEAASDYKPWDSIVFRHFDDIKTKHTLSSWTDTFRKELLVYVMKKCNSNSSLSEFKKVAGMEISW